MGTKKVSQGPDHRNILVKFCRRDTKNEVITRARKMKSTDFYATESLTAPRQTIAYVLRKAKKEFPHIVSGSTTIDGKNFVWTKPTNSSNPNAKCFRQAVHTHSRISDYCMKTLGKPLNHFIDGWNH